MLFWRHLQWRHPTVHPAYVKYKESSKKSIKKESEASQPLLTEFLTKLQSQAEGSCLVYERNHPRQVMLSNSIVDNLITGHNLPVSIVDNSKFRQCLNDFDPKYRVCSSMPSDGHLLHDPKRYESRKAALLEFLAGKSNLAFTMDAWSDWRSRAFLGVTMHAFDDGDPQSRLIALWAFSGPHAGTRIAEELESVIDVFDIQGNVWYIVTGCHVLWFGVWRWQSDGWWWIYWRLNFVGRYQWCRGQFVSSWRTSTAMISSISAAGGKRRIGLVVLSQTSSWESLEVC